LGSGLIPPVEVIVLTGANGFIGREVLAQLSTWGGRVVTITRQPLTAGRARPANLISLIAGSAEYRLQDRPFTLLDCAWCPPTRQSWLPHAAQIRALVELVESAGERLERLVGLGSAEEYGSRSGCLREDDSPMGALSPYGWGKVAARGFFESWAQKSGRPAWWLRPFTVYGEGQQGNMLLAYVQRCFRTGETARCSDGRQRRDFVHVADVARALIAAAAASGSSFRTINVGTGVATPVHETLSRLSELYGASARLELGVIPRRGIEAEEQVADTMRAQTELGWTAQINLVDGLARLKAFKE
jgi:nucleoside-diphosphate-sugar epimerase